MAGVDHAARGKILEEYVEVDARRRWTGEPFEWQGRTVRVTPKPVTQPHPMVLVGGGVPAAARRGRPAAAADAADEHRPASCATRTPRRPKRIGFDGGFVVEPVGPDVRARRRRSRAGVGRDRRRTCCTRRRRTRRTRRRASTRRRACDAETRRRSARRRRSSWSARRTRCSARLRAGAGRWRHHVQPARGRPAARPRVGEPRAVRGRGAAPPAVASRGSNRAAATLVEPVSAGTGKSAVPSVRSARRSAMARYRRFDTARAVTRATTPRRDRRRAAATGRA